MTPSLNQQIIMIEQDEALRQKLKSMEIIVTNPNPSPDPEFIKGQLVDSVKKALVNGGAIPPAPKKGIIGPSIGKIPKNYRERRKFFRMK